MFFSESIHKTSEWNKWLKDQIPNIFLEATKNDPEIRKEFSQYIPSFTDIPDPYWHSVVQTIRWLVMVFQKLESNSVVSLYDHTLFLFPEAPKLSLLSSFLEFISKDVITHEIISFFHSLGITYRSVNHIIDHIIFFIKNSV